MGTEMCRNSRGTSSCYWNLIVIDIVLDESSVFLRNMCIDMRTGDRRDGLCAKSRRLYG